MKKSHINKVLIHKTHINNSKKTFITNFKNFIFLSLIIFLLFFFIKYPEEAVTASRQGMQLWLNTLIPTLLPFIILTSILIKTNMIDKILLPFSPLWKILFGLSPFGVYVFFIGILCGYPMGAKITSDLYENDKISSREAHYLLTFSNNASPAFIINYLYLTCLNKQTPFSIIIGTLFSSTIICMIFFRFIIFRNHTIHPSTTNSYFKNSSTINSLKATFHLKSPVTLSDIKFPVNSNDNSLQVTSNKTYNSKKETSTASSFGTIIDVSIMNGFETITRLGGYILLFSLICAVINHYRLFPQSIQLLLSGSAELTTGLYQLSSASALPYSFKYTASLCLTAFGGFSILAQTRSIVNRKLSIMPYFCAKLLNTAVCALLIFIQI